MATIMFIQFPYLKYCVTLLTNCGELVKHPSKQLNFGVYKSMMVRDVSIRFGLAFVCGAEKKILSLADLFSVGWKIEIVLFFIFQVE